MSAEAVFSLANTTALVAWIALVRLPAPTMGQPTVW